MVRTGGPRVGGGYCTLCEVVIQSLDSQLQVGVVVRRMTLPQDKTNEEEVKQALDVLCYGLSVPVHKACVKLVSQYTEELVDLIVHDFPPK